MKPRGGVCLLAGVAAFAAFQAPAQPYPSKPIRVIVAIAAGSPTDIMMRTAGQQLLGPLGQSLVIENRPGGNQVIGAEACARSAPDGYTFCVVTNTAISVNPHIISKLSYEPDRDFKPVTALWFLINGLVATASLPANSVKELQALAATRPGSLNFATQGSGTGPDIFRQWLNEQWNTNIVGIPYKGANLIMNALIAGEIHFSRIAPLGDYVAVQMKAGKVKLLAVGTSKRLAQFPDVPTYAEAGLDGFPEKTWWGLFAPAGTPDAMVRRIHSEFVRLFHEPKFAAYLESQVVEPAITSPEEFATFLKEDRERAGQTVKKYNVPRQ
ncbi:MAG: hypothetical protein A3H35_02000 [Betaproteobacteria bacterium RIFCSPLOWO2_02_FULL_62_17]|nr:MAG: hypothetical protein A3H35_02000 [Betaproteobacteria bacterium RIFCSPLOWO2_02_FULL_62_17]